MTATPQEREIARIFTLRIWVAAKLGRRTHRHIAGIIEHMHWETAERAHLSSERARELALARIAQGRQPFGRTGVAGAQAPQGD